MEIIVFGSSKAGILRRRAKPVGKITQEVRHLVDSMLAMLDKVGGLGLAAPQVGVGKRLFVAKVEDHVHVVIDPTIVKLEGEQRTIEGCLSIPGKTWEVPRATRVLLKGKNRRGRGITIKAEGLLACVIQHEVDHLDGVLVLDRGIEVMEPELIDSEAIELEMIGPEVSKHKVKRREEVLSARG